MHKTLDGNFLNFLWSSINIRKIRLWLESGLTRFPMLNDDSFLVLANIRKIFLVWTKSDFFDNRIYDVE